MEKGIYHIQKAEFQAHSAGLRSLPARLELCAHTDFPYYFVNDFSAFSLT